MHNNIFEEDKRIFLDTYKRVPLDISFGEGVHLVDKNGNKYLDFFSGLAVNALGYAHPKIVKAVTDQINKFAHLSNNYITEIQIEFADLLLKHSGMSKAFLCNSGTEANEAAIKIIRKIKGPAKKIFSLTNAFHGRTYGSLSLTPKEKYRAGFEPLLPNIMQIKFDDIVDLKEKVNENTAAIFVEFIQGEGGINLISGSFAEELKNLKEKYDFLLVADEIQCGIGRTGNPFAFNYYNIEPDIVTVAKAIGGGLPLGATLISKDHENIFTAGKHGTTFGGNPVCCAAGKVVLEEIFENGLMENANNLGRYLKEQLCELKNLFPGLIKEIRGRGLMVGIEMNSEAEKIVSNMRAKKVLINVTNSNVIRLLPPLIIDKKEIDFFLFNFHETLKQL